MLGIGAPGGVRARFHIGLVWQYSDPEYADDNDVIKEKIPLLYLYIKIVLTSTT